MRCAVLNCRENENGYCLSSSYVQIDETGSCSEMFIIAKSEEEDNVSDN
jgi:hypothetical protein